MKKLVFKLLLILNCVAGRAIGGWEQIQSNTSLRLHSIFFTDSNTGYCAGGGDKDANGTSDGIILKSNDGGETWKVAFTDTMLAIKYIKAIGKRVYCFGNSKHRPVQLISNDSGNTWQYNKNIFNQSIQCYDVQTWHESLYLLEVSNLIKFTNDESKLLLSNISIYNVNENGIIALDQSGENLYSSSDYGVSWKINSIKKGILSGNSMTRASIKFFRDSITINVTYPFRMVYSVDGGKNWSVNYGNLSPFPIYIFSPNTIYGNLNGNLYKSTDWGITWTKEFENYPEIYSFCSINDTIFLCGANGLIIKYDTNK